MFVVFGDSPYPTSHLTLSGALEQCRFHVLQLPRWKNSRHGRKTWHVYSIVADGRPMPHVATVYSYAEENRYQIYATHEGVERAGRDFGGWFNLETREPAT